MFDYINMVFIQSEHTAHHTEAMSSLSEQDENLQKRLATMQSSAPKRRIPVIEEFVPLLRGGLRRGASYQLDGTLFLLMALLIRASCARQWCAVVGMPEFGVEAAHSLGVRLDRVVFVPHVGAQWLSVVSHLIESMTVVAVVPPQPVAEAVAARIAARLRRHQCALLSLGSWPRPEATMALRGTQWQGMSAGGGRLRERTLHVEAVHKLRSTTTTLTLSSALGAAQSSLTAASPAPFQGIRAQPSTIQKVS